MIEKFPFLTIFKLTAINMPHQRERCSSVWNFVTNFPYLSTLIWTFPFNVLTIVRWNHYYGLQNRMLGAYWCPTWWKEEINYEIFFLLCLFVFFLLASQADRVRIVSLSQLENFVEREKHLTNGFFIGHNSSCLACLSLSQLSS